MRRFLAVLWVTNIILSGVEGGAAVAEYGSASLDSARDESPTINNSRYNRVSF